MSAAAAPLSGRADSVSGDDKARGAPKTRFASAEKPPALLAPPVGLQRAAAPCQVSWPLTTCRFAGTVFMISRILWLARSYFL